jgi:hypothetical protein
MSCDLAKTHLGFAYGVDSSAPGFLARRCQIFDLADDDIVVITNTTGKISTQYSDAKSSAAQNVAASLAVEGCYGAFSSAASMSVNSNSSSKHQTVRYDAYVKSNSYEVQLSSEVNLDPHLRLTPSAKKHLLEDDPSEIESRMGVFVPYSCFLGGLYRESYIMDAQEADSESSVTAEITASYGPPGCGVAAKADASSSSRKSNSFLSVKVEWECQGGDSRVWLKANKKNLDEIREKWASSVQDDNLYPFNHKVIPIWQVIAPLDKKKANALQAYLEGKWKTMDLSMLRTSSFKPIPILTVHLEGICDKDFRLGEWAGTKGQSRRLEGFEFKELGDITLEAMVHLEGKGDTPWQTGFMGTRGQSKRVEGFAIRLTGASAKNYTISYRAHLAATCDTGTYHDGSFCGTRGQHKRVEAMFVEIKPK